MNQKSIWKLPLVVTSNGGFAMKLPKHIIDAVAMMILLIQLVMPASAHAHQLELVAADEHHTAGLVCPDADADTSHESSDSHQHGSSCPLDAPFCVMHLQFHFTASASVR